MNNRILAMLLAVIMVFSIVPVNALAAETCQHNATDRVRVEAKAATCTTDGNVEYYRCKCSTWFATVDSDTPLDANEVIIAGGHDYQWVKDNDTHKKQCNKCSDAPATESGSHALTYKDRGDGKHNASCATCGYVQARNHEDSNNDAVCDHCKIVLGHVHVDTKDGNGKCDVVGCDEHVHIMTKMDAKAATCKAEGNLEYYQCSSTECNGKVYKNAEGTAEYTGTEYILNTVAHKNEENVADCLCDFGCGTSMHVLEHKAKVEPSCDERGVKEHYVCANNANHTFSDAEATTKLEDLGISKIAHDWTYTAKPYGENMHIATCKDCGEEKEEACSDTDDCACDSCLALLLHTDNHVTTSAKAEPTCTEAAVSDHYVCTNDKCDAKTFTKESGVYVATPLKDITVQPALGHDLYDGWNYDATGHWHACRRKDCDVKDSFTAHSYDSYRAYPSQPTLKHDGFCECGYRMPAVDHQLTYTERDYGNDSHTATCSVCQESFSDGCVDSDNDCFCDKCKALMEHKHPNNGGTLSYVAEVAAKCEAEGVKAHYVCTGNCGQKFTFSNNVGKYVPVSNDALKIDVLNHQPDKEWSTDGTAHWHECIRAGCPDKVDYAEHTPGKCHEYPSDKSQHFEQCTVCVKSLNIRPHEYAYTTNNDGATHKVECADCGKVIENENCDFNDKCVCKQCGGLEKHEIGDLRTVAAKASTCEETGLILHYTCRKCGNLFDRSCKQLTEADVTVAKLGHNMSNVPGKHYQQCLRENCPYFEYSECEDKVGNDCACDICGKAMHQHNTLMSEKLPTCTEDGHQAYYYHEGCDKKFDTETKALITEFVVYPATGHNFKGAWKDLGNGKHGKACVNGDCTAVPTEGEAHSSILRSNGSACYCDKCNALMHEHELTAVAEDPATCTESGKEAYWYAVCNGTTLYYADEEGTERISGPVTIPSRGEHSYGEYVDNGNGGHIATCEFCAVTYTESHTNKESGCFCDVCYANIGKHKLQSIEAVAPTCLNAGNVAAKYCPECKEYYTENGVSFVLPALGHKWSSWSKEDDSEHGRRCTRSGCGIYEYEDHDLDVKDLTSGNLHEWYCTKCSYYDEEQHYDNNGDSYCDACDHNDGQVNANVSSPSTTITIKGSSSSEKKSSNWWTAFVEKINPSNVGEKEAESGSVNVPASSTNGSGSGNNSETTAPSVSSGSTNVGIFRQLFQFFLGLFGL